MIYASLKSPVNSTPAYKKVGKLSCTHISCSNPAGIKVHAITRIINESVRNLSVPYQHHAVHSMQGFGCSKLVVVCVIIHTVYQSNHICFIVSQCMQPTLLVTGQVQVISANTAPAALQEEITSMFTVSIPGICVFEFYVCLCIHSL